MDRPSACRSWLPGLRRLKVTKEASLSSSPQYLGCCSGSGGLGYRTRGYICDPWKNVEYRWRPSLGVQSFQRVPQKMWVLWLWRKQGLAGTSHLQVPPFQGCCPHKFSTHQAAGTERGSCALQLADFLQRQEGGGSEPEEIHNGHSARLEVDTTVHTTVSGTVTVWS